jgi:hypothetical protein
MNTIATDRKPTVGKDRRAPCCTDPACPSGLRNNYFSGKRITADSFRVEQDYQIERRRLLNRAIHGWGVVYGYAVRESRVAGRLAIGAGLALDPMGRELAQPDSMVLAFDDVLLFDERGTRITRPKHRKRDDGWNEGFENECWLLAVHYAEQSVSPQSLPDPCACERREWDHVCETVRYSLQRIPCDACCEPQDCELDCECHHGPCCRNLDDRATEHRPAEPSEPACEPASRGGCRCLCDHLTCLEIDGECPELCAIEEPCGGNVRLDLDHRVPLACVRLARDECDELVFDPCIEDCGPRRLVKRNDLLFDLIRGCDLTRISAISWADWHRNDVSFDNFMQFFEPTSNELGTRTKFTVHFSKPVQAKTVKADCFTITAAFHEREGGWREVLHVPIVDVHIEPQNGLVTWATFVVRSRFIKDAICGAETRFDAYGATVEIHIHGDYILDCNGQAVDANAVGLRPAPSGNGTPGGTFISVFKILKRDVR